MKIMTQTTLCHSSLGLRWDGGTCGRMLQQLAQSLEGLDGYNLQGMIIILKLNAGHMYFGIHIG